jgi:hypothetical protein
MFDVRNWPKVAQPQDGFSRDLIWRIVRTVVMPFQFSFRLDRFYNHLLRFCAFLGVIHYRSEDILNKVVKSNESCYIQYTAIFKVTKTMSDDVCAFSNFHEVSWIIHFDYLYIFPPY